MYLVRGYLGMYSTLWRRKARQGRSENIIKQVLILKLVLSERKVHTLENPPPPFLIFFKAKQTTEHSSVPDNFDFMKKNTKKLLQVTEADLLKSKVGLSEESCLNLFSK